MCLGFIKKGKDIIFGYNLDIDPAVWDFSLLKNGKVFAVAIKVGSKVFLTHGVNSCGLTACLPYMNDEKPFVKRKDCKRIDLLADDLLRGKTDFDELTEKVCSKPVSNVKFGSLHGLFTNAKGEALLVEPGLEPKTVKDDFFVVSNFPLLKPCEGDNPFFGKKRYETATKILEKSNDGFSCDDGLELLKACSQQGQWATRLSFVYSANENRVYYVLDNDFQNVKTHDFK